MEVFNVCSLTCVSPACPPFLPQVHDTYQSPPRVLLSSAPKTAVVELRGTHTSPTQPRAGTMRTHGSPRPVAKENREADVPQGGNTLWSQWQHHPNRPLLEQTSVVDTGCSSGSHLGMAARHQRGMGVGIEILQWQATHPVTSHFSNFLFCQAGANLTKRLLIARPYWVLNKEKCA